MNIEEAVKFWTVTITKKAGKLFKGQTVDVKARNSAEAIKKGIKQMKGNPALVPSGSVDAVLGESNDLKEDAKKDIENSLSKFSGNDKKDVENLLKFYIKKDYNAFTKQMVKMDTSPAEFMFELISKADAKFMKNAYPNAKRGEYLRAIMYDRVYGKDESIEENLKKFMKGAKKKFTKFGESNDLEEATKPFKELEKAWIRTKGNDKKREKLIKKHNLKPLISNVRQGSIKLGPMNDLKMKDGNHTMAGLDADGELIFISNNPIRIHYPSNTKKRPDGIEMKEDTMAHQRLVRVVEVALGEKPENTNQFIKESNIDLTMTPSSIQKAYKQFNLKK
jgi:hypothetical protein